MAIVTVWAGIAPEVVDYDRTLRFVVSNNRRDRNRNWVDLATLSLGNYAKNPQVFWLHDDDNPPIGLARRVWLADGQLMADIEFLPTSGGDYYFEHYRKGWLRGVSLAARGEYEFVRDGRDWRNCELIHIGLVPIPADPDALSVATSAFFEARYEGLPYPADKIAEMLRLFEIDGEVGNGG